MDAGSFFANGDEDTDDLAPAIESNTPNRSEDEHVSRCTDEQTKCIKTRDVYPNNSLSTEEQTSTAEGRHRRDHPTAHQRRRRKISPEKNRIRNSLEREPNISSHTTPRSGPAPTTTITRVIAKRLRYRHRKAAVSLGASYDSSENSNDQGNGPNSTMPKTSVHGGPDRREEKATTTNGRQPSIRDCADGTTATPDTAVYVPHEPTAPNHPKYPLPGYKVADNPERDPNASHQNGREDSGSLRALDDAPEHSIKSGQNTTPTAAQTAKRRRQCLTPVRQAAKGDTRHTSNQTRSIVDTVVAWCAGKQNQNVNQTHPVEQHPAQLSRVWAFRWGDEESTTRNGWGIRSRNESANPFVPIRRTFHRHHTLTIIRASRPPNTTKYPVTSTEWALPLHLKTLPEINMTKATEIISPELRTAWDAACAEMFSLENLECWAARGWLGEPKLADASASLTMEDIHTLLGFGYIEKIDFASTRGYVRAATVMEKQIDRNLYTRRRFLAEPFVNHYRDFKEMTLLPTLEEQMQAVRAEGAILTDFAQFYRQFRLPTEVRKYYTFSHEGLWFQITSVPTGGRACPALAQALTQSIARAVADWINKGGHTYGTIEVTAYIDNIRFTGSYDSCVKCLEKLKEISSELNVTIDEKQTSEYAQSYEFLGINYNHTDKTISCGDRTLKKLLWMESDWADWRNWTLRLAMRAIGFMIWENRIIGIGLCEFYTTIKFLRRRASSTKLDEPCHLWNSAAQQLWSWWRIAVQKRTRHWNTSTCQQKATLYTDAALSGYGVVLQDADGNVHIIAARWRKLENIMILEARALLKGLSFTSEKMGDMAEKTCLVVKIDNTSVIASCEKQLSANFILNKIVRDVQKECKKFGLTDISYIRTSDNPADLPSRIATYRTPIQKLRTEVCQKIESYKRKQDEEQQHADTVQNATE